MPDIDKINLVSVDSIEKLNSILKENIASVNGLVVVSGVGEPAAAYSVRLLGAEVGISSYTGPAVRVRRTGDDVEADVAFDSGEITLSSAISNTTASETTFGDFVGHGGTPVDAFVDTWYDQSSNANHAEQDTPSSQPQIYDATNGLITENGKPFLKFRGGNSGNESMNMTSAVTCETMFSVVANDTAGFLAYYLWNSGASLGFFSGGTFQVSANGPGVATASLGSISGTVTGQTLLYNDHNGTGWEVGQDGGTASQALATTQKSINQIVRPSTNLQVEKFQECIIWDSDNSSNRSGIEVNINNHFAIGNLPNPTSGLLFDYPDAAAAYSVRQLSNTAPLSMRVRRDTAGGTGDDDEADVLFDFTLTDPTISLDSRINNASTDVASTTLGEFLNATGYTDKDNLTVVADGFCDTWYDQSGNGIDAEQNVPGRQPQIFDSASPTDLIQENGKPLVKATRGGGLAAGFDVSVSLVQAFTVVSVGEVGNLNAHLYADSTRAYWMRPRDSGAAVNSGTSLGTTGTYTHSGQIFNAYVADGVSSYLEATSAAGTENRTGNSGSTDFSISQLLNRSTYDRAYAAQEVIFWNTDQGTTNIAAIELDMDTYYSFS